MNNRFPLLAYPIFRLTVFLTAGIFFSDNLLPENLAWEYPATFFLLSVIILFFLVRTLPFSKRHLFGCMASLSFMLLGACLTQYQKQQIRFD